MGFLGWRKAKWKHADADVRLAAINELTWEHQAVFAQLAMQDPDARVRATAARRVNEQARLEQLLTVSDQEVVRVARERLATVAVKLARERSLAACSAVLTTISDQKSLAELSLEAKDAGVRRVAFERLMQQSDISPAMLALIAVQDGDGAFAAQAVARLDKRNLLKDVARKAKVVAVRTAATARVQALDHEAAKPSPEQNRKARRKALDPLVGEAARWSLSTDFARAGEEIAALIAKRDAVLGQYDVPLEDEAKAAVERIDRAQRDLSRRRDEVVALRAAAVAAHETLLNDLAASAPAPDDDAIAHRARLEARWQSLPALSSTERQPFTLRFAAEVSRLCPTAPANEPTVTAAAAPVEIPAAVLAELEPLVAEAETLATSDRRLDARDRYRVLHKRWHQLTADLPMGHALRTRFLDAYARFKDAGRAARAERDERTKERLSELGTLASEAETLAANPPSEQERQTRFAQLKDLQQRWKSVGAVRPDQVAAVRDRFRAACDTAFAPLKALIEAEDWARFANLGNADTLIAEIDALAVVEDLAVVAGAIKRVQAGWKNLGPLPGDRREAMWQRYKAACDVVYERLKPYFAELDAQRLVNLERKRALLTEAETIANSAPIGLAGSPADLAAKRTNADRMKALQLEWKTGGPVPREHDQELWTRFRAAGDTFFGKHRADIDARHQEHTANLQNKEALCVAVENLAKDCEALAAGEEARVRTEAERLREVKDIQAKWKLIGHVPRDQVEAIWARFRTACDRVYATLKGHLDALEKERQDNLAKNCEALAAG
ncbi:MAG TPA: DUF349 domain-containing protein, partial [Planctomycetota bacterium]|nr:DUF349 domain-containing protein [Planctomycetota bacterium]